MGGANYIECDQHRFNLDGEEIEEILHFETGVGKFLEAAETRFPVCLRESKEQGKVAPCIMPSDFTECPRLS